MKRCPYTWEQLDKEKRELVEVQCPEEIWKGSDEFCIFHDPSPEKDADLFKEKLEKQMESETERHNFIGYYFPEHWNFSGKEFEIDANFNRAVFQDADFREATFQNADFREATFQNANFIGVTFKGTAYFWEATFKGTANFNIANFKDAYFWVATFKGTANFSGAAFNTASFNEATFKGTANFIGATFQDTAYFWRATFHKEVQLTLRNIEKIDFRYTKFLFRSSFNANLTKALFHRCFTENVIFVDCIWPDDYILYEEKHMEDKDINLSFNQLETIYRDLKQNMQNHGDYSKAGEFYYREMEMKRKGAPKIQERFGLQVYKYLAGYGERYWNTAAVSGFVILLFAFLYGITDCLQYSAGNPCLYQEIIDVIYFSFVTFTTLGLGDITPLTTFGKVLICLEAVIGAFMIAVFVVVFVRKMAR